MCKLHPCRGAIALVPMKFQRTSLILVAAALLLGGVVYYMESKNQPQQQEAKTESKPLFNFKEAEVQTFTVKMPKQTVSFEKTAGGAGQSLWKMTSPDKTQANDGAVAFLLNLMATGKSDRTLTIPATRKAEFGLDQPTATVEVKLANQQTHQLVMGKPIFNRSFLYALVDPAGNQDLSISLIPIDFQNAVDRPLAEWNKEKPKAKDPKASPSPAASPSASPSVSPASSPIASPSPSASASPIASPSASPSPTTSPSQ